MGTVTINSNSDLSAVRKRIERDNTKARLALELARIVSVAQRGSLLKIKSFGRYYIECFSGESPCHCL